MLLITLREEPYFPGPGIFWKAQKDQVNITFPSIFWFKKRPFSHLRKIQTRTFQGPKQELFSNQ